MEVKEFLRDQYLEFINNNFLNTINRIYDDLVTDFYNDVMKNIHLNSMNNLKKLEKIKSQFEEESDKIMNVYEEAQRLAEEEDEEEQQDEWEMEHEDEDFDYDPDFNAQAYFFELHLTDLAANHSKKLKEFTENSLQVAKERSRYGLDLINKVFSIFDRLSNSYYEIIENRIKVEKQWIKVLHKNKYNLIKVIFTDQDIEEIWNE